MAEGYLLELEQRCYLKAGHYVPEVVLDNPEVLRMLHREFVHAGSDVVEAFTVCNISVTIKPDNINLVSLVTPPIMILFA